MKNDRDSYSTSEDSIEALISEMFELRRLRLKWKRGRLTSEEMLARLKRFERSSWSWQSEPKQKTNPEVLRNQPARYPDLEYFGFERGVIPRKSEIKKIFRQRARNTHPDVVGLSGAAKFRELVAARDRALKIAM